MTPPNEPKPLGRGLRTRWLLPAAILLLGCCGLLLPSITKVKNGEGWVRSAVSLGQIGEGLLLYREAYGRLPPPIVTDKAGKPLYSWRVELLPYVEERFLYEKFKLDEAWDSPHNKKFLEKTPRCYQPALGGEDGPGLTRYQVFVGPGTAFERPGGTGEDPANLLLVVEAAEPVPWTKPVNLPYAPDMPLPLLACPFSKPTHFLGYEVGRTPGFNAVIGDGTTRFISSKTDENTLRSLISWRSP